MEKILIILVSFLIVFLILYITLYLTIRKKRKTLNDELEDLKNNIQIRDDLIPHILMSVQKYTLGVEKQVLDILEIRSKSFKAGSNFEIRSALENNLTATLKAFLELEVPKEELKKDADFQEVYSNFQYASGLINNEILDFNLKAREFNDNFWRKIVFQAPQELLNLKMI